MVVDTARGVCLWRGGTDPMTGAATDETWRYAASLRTYGCGDSLASPTISNRTLSTMIEKGSFRADLFYRLNVVHLDVPSLRERTEDIPELAGRSLFEFHDTRPGDRVDEIHSDALSALISYPWPGNIRELRNVVERAVLLGSGTTILLEDLPDAVRTGEAEIDLPALANETLEKRGWLESTLRDVREAAIDEVERTYLRHALRATRGRISETASIAGIGARSLYDKLQRYGLKKEDFKEKA